MNDSSASEKPVSQGENTAGDACKKCGGAGFYYLLPEGMNAFKMRYPQLADAQVRHECVYCDARKRSGT